MKAEKDKLKRENEKLENLFKINESELKSLKEDQSSNKERERKLSAALKTLKNGFVSIKKQNKAELKFAMDVLRYDALSSFNLNLILIICRQTIQDNIKTNERLRSSMEINVLLIREIDERDERLGNR